MRRGVAVAAVLLIRDAVVETDLDVAGGAGSGERNVDLDCLLRGVRAGAPVAIATGFEARFDHVAQHVPRGADARGAIEALAHGGGLDDGRGGHDVGLLLAVRVSLFISGELHAHRMPDRAEEQADQERHGDVRPRHETSEAVVPLGLLRACVGGVDVGLDLVRKVVGTVRLVAHVILRL